MIFNRYLFLESIFKKHQKEVVEHVSNSLNSFASLTFFKVTWNQHFISWGDKSSEDKHFNFSLKWGSEEIHFDLDVKMKPQYKSADAFINSFVRQVCHGYFLQAENHFLEKYVYQDDLTGVYNYRRLYKDLEKNIEEFKITSNPFSLVFIDIDNFKKVNDTHGHRTGSSLIKQLSDFVMTHLTGDISVYRYGGDEFVFLCRGNNLSAITETLSEMVESIQAHHFLLLDKSVYNMSVSMGGC
jgi:diguanylate cyclase (GGDEF)-like protein